MALPVGRGMFTLFSYHPVPTEPLPIPKLNLTGMLKSGLSDQRNEMLSLSPVILQLLIAAVVLIAAQIANQTEHWREVECSPLLIFASNETISSYRKALEKV